MLHDTLCLICGDTLCWWHFDGGNFDDYDNNLRCWRQLILTRRMTVY